MSVFRLIPALWLTGLLSCLALASCLPASPAECELWLRPGFDDETLSNLTMDTIDTWLDDYVAQHPELVLFHRQIYDFPRIDATLYNYDLEDQDLPARLLFQYSFQADGSLLITNTYSGFIDIPNREMIECLGTPSYVEAYHTPSERYFAVWYPAKGITIVRTISGDFADPSPIFRQTDSQVRTVFYIPSHIRDEWSLDEIAHLVRRSYAYDYPDDYPLQPWPGSWEAIQSIEFQE